jgi:uncharacterized protein YndB with AHSA1/START domain
MWTKTQSMTFPNITPAQVWAAWSNINDWPLWNHDLEWTKLHGEFKVGSVFYMKIKKGPIVTIEIIECTPNKSFTDCTKFPLAKMYDTHQIEQTHEGLRITSSLKVTGPLGFLWRKLVAEKVAADVPAEMNSLITFIREMQHA